MAHEVNTGSLNAVKDMLPTYDGNQKLLQYYIRQVDSIVALVPEISPDILAPFIRNRMKGKAVEAMATAETIDSWTGIKAVLQRRFGEYRTETQVIQQLVRITRYSKESCEAYGSRIRDILDTLMTIGQNPVKSYYEAMATEQFINCLPQPIMMGVRISAPINLEQAITCARQEESRASFIRRNTENYFNNKPGNSNNNASYTQRKPQNFPKQIKSDVTMRSLGQNKPLWTKRNSDVTMRSVNKPQQLYHQEEDQDVDSDISEEDFCDDPETDTLT